MLLIMDIHLHSIKLFLVLIKGRLQTIKTVDFHRSWSCVLLQLTTTKNFIALEELVIQKLLSGIFITAYLPYYVL